MNRAFQKRPALHGLLAFLALGTGLREAAAAPAEAVAVELRCVEMPRERAAAFEARARAELLVRGERGTLELDCARRQLWWTPRGAAPRALRVEGLQVDSLLETLERLLAADAPGPARPPEVTPPRPFAELRGGAEARLWQDFAAGGARLAFAWQPNLLSWTASGHMTTALSSLGGVRIHVLEARLGLELAATPWLRVGGGAGFGRPFTSVSAGLESDGAIENAWFGSGWLRASTRIDLGRRFGLHAGAELDVSSRPVQLFIDETRRLEFQWQPGAFLELGYELW